MTTFACHRTQPSRSATRPSPSHPSLLPLAVALLLALPALLHPAAIQAQGQNPGQGDTATYRVWITNLTRGQVLAPPVAITHSRNYHLFTLGAPASPGLAALAEDAVVDTLFAELEADPEVLDFTVGAGPIPPGGTAMVEVESRFPQDLITVTQMLVQTNDAFFAAGGMPGPRGPEQRRITFHANAYDAGSESNTELCASIPGPPCGNALVRDTAEAEGFVHVHAGIHGIGDLEAARYDWRNPVAEITVVRVHR